MKKLFKVLLAAVLLVSVAAVSICAEGSPSKIGRIIDWTAYDVDGNEYDHEIYELVFDEKRIEEIDRHDEALRNTMAKVNAGEKDLLEFLKERGVSLPSNTASAGMYTEIRDLIVRRKDTKERVQAFNVTATIEVPALMEGNGQVYIYHYSTLYKTNELINPTSVDYANKAVTATFNDLSPISFIYVKTTQKPVDTAAMDYTGLFAALAAAAALALFAVNKKEKTAA